MLYTNVPIELIADAIIKRKDELVGKTDIPYNQLIHGIDVIMNNTFFTFNNHFYKQIFGLPMGSPLAPICADLVMALLEENCLEKLDFPVPCYFRYVDDIFTCLPRDRIDETLRIFNSYHSRLQFTYEVEENGSLPFLDVRVIRDSNNVIFDWFRKTTWSGRMLNFNSMHPISQKRAIVLNLADRVFKICDTRFVDDNIKLVKKILIFNDYPISFFSKILENRIQMIVGNKNNDGMVIHKEPIEYKKTLIVPFSYMLTSSLKECCLQFGVRVLSTITNKIGNYYKSTKDQIHRNARYNVIYKIPCGDCNKVYIGKTTRCFEKREKEHRRSERNPDLYRTGLSSHSKEFHHHFDFDNTVILGNAKPNDNLNILEMFYIKKYNNITVNFMNDCKKLGNSYDHLIKFH